MSCILVSLALTSLWVVQVGNPLLDKLKNTKGEYEFLWNYGVMSDEVWGEITKLCRFGPVESAACNDRIHAWRHWKPVKLIATAFTSRSAFRRKGVI